MESIFCQIQIHDEIRFRSRQALPPERHGPGGHRRARPSGAVATLRPRPGFHPPGPQGLLQRRRSDRLARAGPRRDDERQRTDTPARKPATRCGRRGAIGKPRGMVSCPVAETVADRGGRPGSRRVETPFPPETACCRPLPGACMDTGGAVSGGTARHRLRRHSPMWSAGGNGRYPAPVRKGADLARSWESVRKPSVRERRPARQTGSIPGVRKPAAGGVAAPGRQRRQRGTKPRRSPFRPSRGLPAASQPVLWRWLEAPPTARRRSGADPTVAGTPKTVVVATILLARSPGLIRK